MFRLLSCFAALFLAAASA